MLTASDWLNAGNRSSLRPVYACLLRNSKTVAIFRSPATIALLILGLLSKMCSSYKKYKEMYILLLSQLSYPASHIPHATAEEPFLAHASLPYQSR